MKTMLVLGALGSCMLAASPSAVLAQSNLSINSPSVAETCKSALQGGKFSQVIDVTSPPCCHVSIEEDWYKANGVVLSGTYRRSNGDTYRAASCRLISYNGSPVDETTTGSIGGGNSSSGARPPVSANAPMPSAINFSQTANQGGLTEDTSRSSSSDASSNSDDAGGTGASNSGASPSAPKTGGESPVPSADNPDNGA